MQKLTATKRSKTDKLKAIRTNGMVPAVVYGARVENTLISVPSVAFDKVFKVAGESSAITLDLEGKNIDALIYSVQADPIRGFPIHVDFLAIDMNKKVTVTVPIEFTGVAPADKDGLGTLVKVTHECEIEALPKDLPQHVIVDISTLVTLEDQIHAKDIILPTGVTLVTPSEEVIALVTAAKEEKESMLGDVSTIEVEKKGKKEVEEEKGE